ncbi:type I secretion system permease/ATPase [Phyllobacterium sp. LjRoot231]|uniref:type I secretion system permease/ATPase n=1 Tax=Phyllobacterium sp. LjRoot231 TaxID=3342289 RepID=UPI003ECEE0DF
MLKRGGNLGSEVAAALGSCRNAFIGIAIFSCFVNMLYLSGSAYMLEVYDRVLPSRSVPTLIGLTVIISVLYAFQGCFDLIRRRLLMRVGERLDDVLSPRLYDVMVRLPLKAPDTASTMQPLRDLDTIRSFLIGGGPTALFDLPWLPFYIAICFVFHFWLGMTALGGAILLVGLTYMTEVVTRRPVLEGARYSAARNRLAEASRRNAEVIVSMGMASRIHARWQTANRAYMDNQRDSGDLVSGLGAVSRMLRMLLQSGVLAVGAWLVINQQASAGIIIAGSILSSRALAPVDFAIANWKGFVGARQSKQRLDKILKILPEQEAPMELPAPVKTLALESIAASPPERQKIVLQDVHFLLKAGMGLGVIGPSASGKSPLARLLVGAWTPLRGTIRLDGATLDQWSPAVLGRHVGYLPQDVDLIEGTVAENIASFDPQAEPEAIIEAAKAARVHDLIVGLTDGYETAIGEQGTALSAGQQQRVALARALYGNPFLVVLDEPNSNLDSDGEDALTQAILSVRQRGGIVVVIAHRPSALAGVDMVLALNNGRQLAFGPKEEVVSKVLRSANVIPINAGTPA